MPRRRLGLRHRGGHDRLPGDLQALIGRSITGEGRHIAVSLYHALADWMNVPYLQYAYGGIYPPRSGLNHPTIAPYGAYPCADGKAILFSIQNEREWASLCENVLDDAAVATDPRFDANVKRVANRAALDAIILAAFARHPREAVVEKLERAKVAYGRVSSLDDLKVHPQNAIWRWTRPPAGSGCWRPARSTTARCRSSGRCPRSASTHRSREGRIRRVMALDRKS